MEYQGKSQASILRYLCRELKELSESGQQIVIVYSSGTKGAEELARSKRDPRLSEIEGSGNQAVLLRTLSDWIQNDDRNKTLRDAVYAAPVVIRQGSSRAHVDDAINHLKNKISDGSKVLLIANKDSSHQYPFCYGMKNKQISRDFDHIIVDYLQQELTALLT